MSYVPKQKFFKMDDEVLKILNIPIIEIIDNHEEIWTYVLLDRNHKFNGQKKYIVSTYGRVYNIETRHLLSPYDSYESSKGHYKSVKLRYNDDMYAYLVHRLVALAFIPRDINRIFVNHKDGIPYHNYVWNLEWCTQSENTQHAIDTGLKKDKLGENRSNAIWTDAEVNTICKMMSEGHKSTYIYRALGDIYHDSKMTYERVHTLYKHIIHKTHWTHISCKYDIDFTRKNYLKENASVLKKELS